MPLPAVLPLHGPLPPPSTGLDEPVASPPGPGRIVVRFVRDLPDDPGVTVWRDGDAADLPRALAAVAGLPILPLALGPTRDRVGLAFRMADNHLSERGSSTCRHDDPAVGVRLLERSALIYSGPNKAGTPQGFASLLFAAEPGLWHLLPDGATPPEPDVTVTVSRLMPPNSMGDIVFHSSADGTPTADGPEARHPAYHLRIAPAERHRENLRESPEEAERRRLFAAWTEALAPMRVTTWDAEGLEVRFEQAYFASCYAAHTGMPLPDGTPYGPTPSVHAKLDHRGPHLQPEELLGPAELDAQRRLLASAA